MRRLIGLAGALALAGACSSSGGEAASQGHSGDEASAWPETIGQPDRPFGGPQGDIPQFIAECALSHTSAADPIVAPGREAGEHVHVFFGAHDTDGFSTAATLLAAPTTCDQQLDHSAYWAPALYNGGRLLEPDKVTAYYRPGPAVEPTSVRPYPLGLKVVAGGGHDLPRPPVSIAAWTCGVSPRNEPDPPDCPADQDLRMVITFPDCWDGSSLDSADHRSHTVYSREGTCPAGHSVPIPQLTLTFAYPVGAADDDYTLASGSLDTLHADFFNAWDEAKLAAEVSGCLNRAVVCDVTSTKK